MSANDLYELDRQHLVHPVSAWATQEAEGPLVLDRGSGLTVKDHTGREYLDGFAGLWCVNVGYGQKTVVEAMNAQAEKLAYVTGYFGFASETAIRLAARLAELTPGDLDHIYLTQGGSDSVDSAVRLIRYYWSMKGEPQREHMIALEYGYHGSSSTGAGLTALANFHRGFALPLATQHHIEAPYPYRHRTGLDADVIADCEAALRAKVAELGADKVAAFFCEPVIGSGGVIVPPKGWLKAMEKTCRELGILFVVDEVITGFGRTASMFACDHEDVVPDMMTMAKGLTSGYAPMGALAISDRIYREIRDLTPDGKAIGHGATYSGHPVAAAAALEVIRLYTDGGILSQAQKIAPYFEARLRTLADHPLVGDIRISGLLAGIELVSDRETRAKFAPELKVGKKLLGLTRDLKLLVRCFDDGIIGLAPALTITPEEVDLIVERLRDAFDALMLQV